MKYNNRVYYTKLLASATMTNLIKIVTGVRRSGKSTVLKMYSDTIEEKYGSNHVFVMNFEQLAGTDVLKDHSIVYDDIISHLDISENCFVFLDEIQLVNDYESLIDRLFVTQNIDLYITGSNAYLLSSDLATLFAGRYIEIKMLPYSFSEFHKALDISKFDNLGLLDEYITYGSLPETVNLRKISIDLVTKYLDAVYQSIVTKDVIFRYKLHDKSLLQRVIKFLLSNVGSPVSAKKIADNLSVEYRNVKSSTIDKILSALEESYIFYRADRFEIKGREILKTNAKFYPVDLGIRNAALGSTSAFDYGHQLESIVYFELLRRGKKVFVGKSGDSEVDFVLVKDDGTYEYYQVAYTTMDPITLARELKPLQKIRDNLPKYILSTDSFESNENGILRLNVEKWLLGD